MTVSDDFKQKREERRQLRQKRENRLKKWVPVVEAVCKRNQIELREIVGGYQFRVNEYVMSWWLRSNKIVIQYPGDSTTTPFEHSDSSKDPKIIVALNKLIRVTKGGTS